jgi:uncharacterized repeat protein (TIGR01451 family)
VRRHISRPTIEHLEDRLVLSTLTVTNLNDSPNFTLGDGSLRGEIAAAAKGDTIQFSPTLAGGTINLTDGQLTINKNLTITGPSASDVIVNAGLASRVFDIEGGQNGVTVKLSNLAIENGSANTGAGLLINDVAGTVTLSNLLIANNFAFGGAGAPATHASAPGSPGQNAQGGGLAFFGGTKATLVLTGDTVQHNQASGGKGGLGGFGGIVASGGGSGDGFGGAGGAGGAVQGGGLYLAGGTVRVSGSTISNNRLAGGQGGIGGDGGVTASAKNGPGGNGGDSGSVSGGGLYVATGTVQLTGDTFQGNSLQGGNGGTGGSGGNHGGTPGANGATGFGGGANGGAVAVAGGSVQVTADRLLANIAAAGSNKSSNNGVHAGGTALGGGLYAGGGSVVLSASAVFQNTALGGGATTSPGGGYGGGVAIAGGSAQLSDDTIAQNQVQGGGANTGGDGSALGGGVIVVQGSARLTNNTITQNAALDANGFGGGFLDFTSLAALANNIFAYNTAANGPDVYFLVGPSDHDLVFNTSGSAGWSGSDLLNVDPHLAPLGLYGGFTETMPLTAGSPAIDAGDSTVAPAATDQTGYARIVGGAIDIGASEYGGHTATGDLAVTGKTSTLVVTGNTLTYTLTVTNHGKTAQANVTVADVLPAGTTLASWSTTAAGWTLFAPAAGQSGTASAVIASLAAGASASFTLVLNVTAPAGLTVSNTFAVGPTLGDPKVANNTVVFTTKVIAPGLVINGDVLVQAGSITYNAPTHQYVQTLTLTNASNLTFNGPVAVELNNLPSTVTLANATGTIGGDPFIEVVPTGKKWLPNQKVTVTLRFKAPSAQAISYVLEEVAGL